MLIGEGLKLNLNSIQKIDLSHNPLGHLGVMFILNSKSECPSIKHYGVQETSAAKLRKVEPIRITNEETKLFHGIDERISIDNLVRVCIFMRNFIEQTDATFSQRKHAKSKYNE